MALIDEKPAGLKSTNTLDQIPDDLLGPIPHEIRLGANKLMILEKPPNRGDYLDVTLRLRIKGGGDEQPTPDGPVFYYKQATIVGAWLKGDPEPPDPTADQPPLFGDGGEPTADATGEGWEYAQGEPAADEDS